MIISFASLSQFSWMVPPLTGEALVPGAAAYPSVMDNPPLAVKHYNFYYLALYVNKCTCICLCTILHNSHRPQIESVTVKNEPLMCCTRIELTVNYNFVYNVGLGCVVSYYCLISWLLYCKVV